MWKGLSLLLLLGFVQRAFQCPPVRYISPYCKCEKKDIKCNNISEVEDLRRVFQNAQGYTFDSIFIENSSLPFLPHNLFLGVTLTDLFLKNVTLEEFFEALPEGLEDLDTLLLQNFVILRGETWKFLQPLRKLRYLLVYSTPVESLGEDFNRYVPKGLEQIVLSNTKTRTLEPGVFHNFTHLDVIQVSNSPELQELTRSAFPDPYNGRFIFVQYNGLSRIPADIFHNMPNLVFIRLMHNQLSSFPETVFGGNLYGIRLEGNPLHCDCDLKWMTNLNLEDLHGDCFTPEEMKGTKLKDLGPRHFLQC